MPGSCTKVPVIGEAPFEVPLSKGIICMEGGGFGPVNTEASNGASLSLCPVEN